MDAVLPLPVVPLLALDGDECARLVCPFVPDAGLVLLEVHDVGVALQEPEQLDDDLAQVQLLGGEEREASLQVESHLVAEDRKGADAGAVLLRHTLGKNRGEEVMIGLHKARYGVRGGPFQAASNFLRNGSIPESKRGRAAR